MKHLALILPTPFGIDCIVWKIIDINISLKDKNVYVGLAGWATEDTTLQPIDQRSYNFGLDELLPFENYDGLVDACYALIAKPRVSDMKFDQTGVHLVRPEFAAAVLTDPDAKPKKKTKPA